MKYFTIENTVFLCLYIDEYDLFIYIHIVISFYLVDECTYLFYDKINISAHF